MSKITIRDARRGDGAAIARIHRANSAVYVELAPLEAQLQPPLESARCQSGPHLGEPCLFIGALGTAPEFQRRGVATRLVEAAEEWGRSCGATLAACDTFLGSPMSLPFWEERMGYARHAVILHKPLVP